MFYLPKQTYVNHTYVRGYWYEVYLSLQISQNEYTWAIHENKSVFGGEASILLMKMATSHHLHCRYYTTWSLALNL